MKKDKGFSLAECVVAIGIVMLISFGILTTCLIAVSNANKSNALQIINNENLNLVKIVKNVDLESGGEYFPSDLENALMQYFGIGFELELDKLNRETEVSFSDSGELDLKGNIKMQITFARNNECLAVYSACCFKTSELKAKTLLFEKYVNAWSN